MLGRIHHFSLREVSPGIVCHTIQGQVTNPNSRQGFYGVSQVFANAPYLAVEQLGEDNGKCGVIDFSDCTWPGHRVYDGHSGSHRFDKSLIYGFVDVDDVFIITV